MFTLRPFQDRMITLIDQFLLKVWYFIVDYIIIHRAKLATLGYIKYGIQYSSLLIRSECIIGFSSNRTDKSHETEEFQGMIISQSRMIRKHVYTRSSRSQSQQSVALYSASAKRNNK